MFMINRTKPYVAVYAGGLITYVEQISTVGDPADLAVEVFGRSPSNTAAGLMPDWPVCAIVYDHIKGHGDELYLVATVSFKNVDGNWLRHIEIQYDIGAR